MKSESVIRNRSFLSGSEGDTRKRIEELLAYFVKHGREVYFIVPALILPLAFFSVSLQSYEGEVSWERALFFSLWMALLVPAMAFNIHLIARFVFLKYFPSRIRTLWPNLGFQALLFVVGISLGTLVFRVTLDWVGDAGILLIAESPLSFFPIPVFGLVSFFYFSSKYYREEFARAHEVALTAEYNALKAQMQPHFLFNSLNTLSELIETDRKEASDMVQELADLYRYILQMGQKKTSSLDAEITIVKKYLSIQKQRLGERLEYQIAVPASLPSIELPGLCLQTLVENAIRHGIAPRPKGGLIRVEITPTETGAHRFLIANSGLFLDTKARLGTGLTNCISRLTLLYGERHQFRIFGEGEETWVEFFVPALDK